MFDEWGYGIVAESQRHESVVQEIAAASSEFPLVDYPQLLVRRNSLPRACAPSPLALEFPFTRRERLRFWERQDDSPQELPRPLGGDLAMSFLDDMHSGAADLAAALEATDRRIDAAAKAVSALELRAQEMQARTQELDTLHEDIGGVLRICDRLEEITRILNTPGTRAVSSASFPSILSDIKLGLEFCRAHPDFRDMDLYELRHSQAQARAYSMVLDHCTSTWRTVQTRIMSGNSAPPEALLWAKFAAETARLQPLIAATDGQIRSELEGAYAQVRGDLLAPRLLQPGTFSQTLARISDTLDRERKLWAQVFGSDEKFEEYSRTLAEPAYIEIRTRVVHETSVAALADMIALVQDDKFAVSRDIYRDAQSRLLFRAQQILDTALALRPTANDLREPEFPPTKDTLSLLSQLYEVMTPSVFEQFAHQAIRGCIQALQQAPAVDTLGVVEGSLWRVRHTLALQQDISSYDLQQISEQHIDFGGLLTLIHTVRTAPQGLSFDKVVGSMPQVVEQVANPGQELHSELKSAVSQFTTACVSDLLAPLAKNDPHSAIKDAETLRTQLPPSMSRIQTLVEKHITTPKIVDALMDSMFNALVETYAEYYATIYDTGSPDQLQGVFDTDSFMTWLVRIREQ